MIAPITPYKTRIARSANNLLNHTTVGIAMVSRQVYVVMNMFAQASLYLSP